MDFDKIIGIVVLAFVLIILFVCIKNAIQSKIEENNEKKLIQSHVDRKDYVWILENCGENKYGKRKEFHHQYYTWNYKNSKTIKEMILLSKIPFLKKIEYCYYHDIELFDFKTTYSLKITAHPNIIEDLNLDVENIDDLISKYVFYNLLDFNGYCNSQKHENRKNDISNYISYKIKNFNFTVEEIENKINCVVEYLEKICINKNTSFKSLVDLDNLLNPFIIKVNKKTTKIKESKVNKDEKNTKKKLNTKIENKLNHNSIVTNNDDKNYVMIRNHKVLYRDNDHKYFVDGNEVISVTTLLKHIADDQCLDDYSNINPEVLKRAAAKGTKLHKEIEDYENKGIKAYSCEFENYLYLKNEYGFNCIENEQLVLFCDDNDVPIYCGRLDMIISMDGEIGLADIKRTSKLYPEKVQMQLNLYRLAYIQSYGKDINFMCVIRLRDYVKELIKFDIDEENTISNIINYIPDFSNKFSLNIRKTQK